MEVIGSRLHLSCGHEPIEGMIYVRSDSHNYVKYPRLNCGETYCHDCYGDYFMGCLSKGFEPSGVVVIDLLEEESDD